MSPSWRAFCETAHLSALGIWAGAVAIGAVTAAIAFPTLRDMNVQIPDLAGGAEPLHYRFAAGAVANQVFIISDSVAFVCSLVACATLLALLMGRAVDSRRPSTYVRALSLGVALASLASILFLIAPRISAATKLHYAAAKAGDAAGVALHHQTSADLHPISINLTVAEVVAVLIALILGAWSVSTAGRVAAPTSTSPYPEPALAHRRT